MPSPPSHPYYPLDANVVGYEPNQTPVLELLISAGGACTILLGATFALASYVKPALRMTDRIAILWFVLCKAPRQEPVEGCMLTIWGYIAGALHCFFEGYFMFHHSHMASAQDLFGQLWKEYALSDSRYMTSDTLVLCMETMTVVSHTAFYRTTRGFTADSHQASVGTIVLCCCILDRNQAFSAPLDPGHCVHEPSVRRHVILCDQFV